MKYFFIPAVLFVIAACHSQVNENSKQNACDDIVLNIKNVSGVGFF